MTRVTLTGCRCVSLLVHGASSQQHAQPSPKVCLLPTPTLRWWCGVARWPWAEVRISHLGRGLRFGRKQAHIALSSRREVEGAVPPVSAHEPVLAYGKMHCLCIRNVAADVCMCSVFVWCGPHGWGGAGVHLLSRRIRGLLPRVRRMRRRR